ncbi:Radical SAM enzyme, Cfr family [Elusimicrobium minutum Pei191]|uniref:Radical SAM enzyme, Cfr family n=1 Tax=Elusimicrobium minutum (strain Pei191) TaxID=445932 RepID=B2KDX7_ELUMP|nr:23S rRNA (adenine(2503)-C(2))-methyltransferase RlmN [Elusimicrobium minutum]ACC98723.1 Radical SAM enzyme, Cfr family [Elusimicrobium minutum Pei191]
MNFEKIKDFIKENGFPAYRIAQVKDAVYKNGITDWNKAVALPADLKNKLKDNFNILSFTAAKMQFSDKDRTAKALLKLEDGLKIETVLMRMGDVWTVCVSTQVGCPVGCSFCSTGKMRFKRDLTDEEISDQVLFWLSYIKQEKLAQRINNVVFMGMGEPLFNYLNTVKAVKEISNPDRLGIGMRHISISTSGVADKFHNLAVDLPQVNLALSLHSADDDERNKIVPLNRKFNLETLQKALTEYIAMTGRQVFIEYTVVEGVNDRPEHIRLLGKWISGVKDNYLLHVNLIACNMGKGKTTSEKQVKLFAKGLQGLHISVTIRKSLGNDILAACGQLAVKESKEK